MTLIPRRSVGGTGYPLNAGQRRTSRRGVSASVHTFVVLLLSLVAAGCSARLADPNEGKGKEAPTKIPWDVDTSVETLRESVHADLDCMACHQKQTEADETGRRKLGAPDCTGCHSTEAEAYNASVHGQKIKDDAKSGAARCQHCHGAHDIFPTKDPRSWVNKRQVPRTCARCHQNPELAEKLGIKAPWAASRYMESIHGLGLVEGGMIVAPSCVDCHGHSHHIEAADSPSSTVNRKNIPDTCGQCHLGIEETYQKSIHGQKMLEGDPEAPTCISCHTAHQIEHPAAGFKLISDQRCGKCHEDRLKLYLETYHGRAHSLGEARVAACYDCHGHHDVQPSSNPQSKLSEQNKLATCRSCHPDAPPKLTGFLAHGDHSDKENYPELYWIFLFMTILTVGVFGFFGLHTLAWFGRSVVDMVRDPKAFREAKKKRHHLIPGKTYVRFRAVDRFCHSLVITSFLLLVGTGMPLKFHTEPWAKAIFDYIGGANVAATLHRVGAVITFLYFTIHIASLVGPLYQKRAEYRDEDGSFSIRKFLAVFFGPDSPAPNPQDLRDFWAHTKYFFGRGPKPDFDRFTYWEKFDYLAVFWGVAVIGLSGLVMWFPEWFTLTLPGWIINVAHVIHSDEALLAAGFIFTFHFFNSHFRPEKMPLDSVMFSGKISEEEMLQERGRQYARLKAAGKLDDLKPGDEWSAWKWVANPLGMIAFSIGVALVVAIFWAMAKRML